MHATMVFMTTMHLLPFHIDDFIGIALGMGAASFQWLWWKLRGKK